jgi:hypothetical protein
VADQKSDPKPQPKKDPAPPGDAAASGDPVVQQLLAHREIAVLNGDEDAVKAVNARLAELGVA